MSHYFPTVNAGLKANHGKGRPKGSLNKTHATIRWSLIEAFRLNGGVDALAKWGKANPDLFYPMLTKLLPTELAEAGYSGDNRIQVVILPPEHSQSQVAGNAGPTEVVGSKDKPLETSSPQVILPSAKPLEGNYVEQERGRGASSAGGGRL